MSWTWSYLRFDDTPVNVILNPGGSFPSQADAESWIGEFWRDLLAEGVDQVSLLEDGREVYGPMSLHPPE
jgi:hypothetical protein